MKTHQTHNILFFHFWSVDRHDEGADHTVHISSSWFFFPTRWGMNSLVELLTRCESARREFCKMPFINGCTARALSVQWTRSTVCEVHLKRLLVIMCANERVNAVMRHEPSESFKPCLHCLRCFTLHSINDALLSATRSQPGLRRFQLLIA